MRRSSFRSNISSLKPVRPFIICSICQAALVYKHMTVPKSEGDEAAAMMYLTAYSFMVRVPSESLPMIAGGDLSKPLVQGTHSAIAVVDIAGAPYKSPRWFYYTQGLYMQQAPPNVPCARLRALAPGNSWQRTGTV